MSSEILNRFQNENSTTSLDRLYQCLTPLTLESFFTLDKISWFLFCVHCLSSCQQALTEKSLSLSSLTLLPDQIFIYLDEMPLRLVFSKLNGLFSQSSYVKCSNPLIIPMALCWIFCKKSISVLHPGAQIWAHHSGCVSPVLSSDKCPPNAVKEAVCLLC